MSCSFASYNYAPPPVHMLCLSDFNDFSQGSIGICDTNVSLLSDKLVSDHGRLLALLSIP